MIAPRFLPSVEALIATPRFIQDCPSSKTVRFNLNVQLERLGIRDSWTRGWRLKLVDRLQRPRFGFPGVNDRAPAPPKTLHWQFAPAEGEYMKIRAILCWATIHVWLLTARIPEGHPYRFLTEKSFDFLHSELVSVWLPEASIPAFSLKGEAKRLVDECRETLDVFLLAKTGSECMHRIWIHGFRDRGLEESDPRLGDLVAYLVEQKEMMGSLPLTSVVEEPSSWGWLDSVAVQ